MSIALSILLGATALWWALRFLPAGADGHGPLPYLIAFVRFLWIPSIILSAIALIFHHWIIAALAAILAILTGSFAAPWYRKTRHAPARQDQTRQQRSPDREIQHTDNHYSVMTLNCRYGLADPQSIIDAVRSNEVSILALQELTQNLVSALDQAGITKLLPYRQLGKAQENDNGGFNGIFSAIRPDVHTERTIDVAAADVPYCEINGVAVYSAHPKSPMRGCREWSHGIISLATLGRCTADNNRLPEAASTTEAIIMGDLNSNLDHPSFRKLLDAGFADAGLDTSHAAAASFPQWLVWPRLELDHILVTSGIAASNVRTLAIPGSDHLALLAQLRHR